MPKLDLTKTMLAKRQSISDPSGPGILINRLKGTGFEWKAYPLMDYAPAIPVHLRHEGIEHGSGHIVQALNHGSLGSAVVPEVRNSTTAPSSDIEYDIDGKVFRSQVGMDYLFMNPPVQMVGKRFMFVTSLAEATNNVVFWGQTGESSVRLAQILTGDMVYLALAGRNSSGILISQNITPRFLLNRVGLHLLELVVEGANASFTVDGVQVASITNNAVTSLMVASAGVGTTTRFTGWLGEALCVDRAHPDYAEAVIAARSYLADKYNISVVNRIAADANGNYTINSPQGVTLTEGTATFAV